MPNQFDESIGAFEEAAYQGLPGGGHPLAQADVSHLGQCDYSRGRALAQAGHILRSKRQNVAHFEHSILSPR